MRIQCPEQDSNLQPTECDRGGSTDTLLIADRINGGCRSSRAIVLGCMESHAIHGVDPGSRWRRVAVTASSGRSTPSTGSPRTPDYRRRPRVRRAGRWPMMSGASVGQRAELRRPPGRAEGEGDRQWIGQPDRTRAVINKQAALGYRLHTITTASSGSKGVIGGGERVQATMVFERIAFG